MFGPGSQAIQRIQRTKILQTEIYLRILVNVRNRKNTIAKDFNGYIVIIVVMNFHKNFSTKVSWHFHKYFSVQNNFSLPYCHKNSSFIEIEKFHHNFCGRFTGKCSGECLSPVRGLHLSQRSKHPLEFRLLYQSTIREDWLSIIYYLSNHYKFIII